MNNGEFKGTTKQAISDIQSRLDRIENKLDRFIEKNILIATISSGIMGVIVAIIAAMVN